MENDQKFWKQRLQKRLKLTSKRDDLDFKTITKFLDNGKSFEENYEEAMNKNYGEVVYILIENKVVEKIEPSEILREIFTDVPALAEIKSLSDQDFYDELINQSNEINENDDKISRSYFNKIVFTGDVLKIEIPNFLEEPMKDPEEDRDENEGMLIIDIKNDGMGLTNGKIIRAIANSIPTVEELKRSYIDYVTKNPRKAYDQIEKERKYHKDRMEEYRKNPRLSQRVKDIKDELDKFNETYPPLEMMRLLKNPKDLAVYIAEHGDVFNGYEYGSHIYFEGLSKYNGDYRLDLGS